MRTNLVINKNMFLLRDKCVDRDGIIKEYLVIQDKNDIWLFLKLGTILKKRRQNTF
jgi:hypothetical protein